MSLRLLFALGVLAACADSPAPGSETHYACVVGQIRNGAYGGTPVCPIAPSCAQPYSGISGSGSFCNQFTLDVADTKVTWEGCFT